MRIIGGKVGGMRLTPFEGNRIRPTLDRVKESLFSQIQPWLKDARFLDCFAGTGAIGLEAWSRGAKNIIFIEKEEPACDVIRTNIEKCKCTNTAMVLHSDALQALSWMKDNKYWFDIIYVDPPFDPDLYDVFLEKLANSTVLEKNSVVIVEHYHKKTLNESYGNIFLSRQRKVGDTKLSFFGRQSLFK